MEKVNLFWFRRDLRLEDNAGLYHALKSGLPVVPIFIFDTNILDELENKKDRRVAFIHSALESIQKQLIGMGSTLEVYYGRPLDVFKNMVEKYAVAGVFTNHDYEPYAIQRDDKVRGLLAVNNITFHSFKDHVIFEKNEVLKDDGSPYTVFTPYSRKWKSVLTDLHLAAYPAKRYFNNFYKQETIPIPSLFSMGFESTSELFPSLALNELVIKNYAAERDFPYLPGTSRLGVHLRFGTISIRALALQTRSLSATYLNELIWREFYQAILYHFPQIAFGKAFRPEYDAIEWRRDDGEFERWCNGQTGYPIVDAGMRELNETGFMHNRVRMIVASFLSKHLLLDWRLGEAYFAEKLLDYEFASNNGGWQWAAGCGCDAAPYFRIFNPYLQTKKFDPQLKYVSKWVPEFQEFTYPKPMVVHEEARQRCLEVYSKALRNR